MACWDGVHSAACLVASDQRSAVPRWMANAMLNRSISGKTRVLIAGLFIGGLSVLPALAVAESSAKDSRPTPVARACA